MFEAREHRSVANTNNEEDHIEIDPFIRDELFSILLQKNKYIQNCNFILQRLDEHICFLKGLKTK